MRKYNDEINLAEFIIPIWKNKILILITAIAFALLGKIYFSTQEPPKRENIIKTTIKPISTFEEIEYQLYNNFVSESLSSYSIVLDEEYLLLNNLKSPINRTTPIFDLINKEFLLKLFVEKIRDTKFLKNELKKSGLIKIDESKNIEDLIYSIKFSKSSIKNNQNNINWFIEFKTSNIIEWSNFLINLEKNANLEIRDYLKSKFQNQVLHKKNNNKFKIEDIEQLIKSKDIINGQYIDYLLALREKLKSNKDMMRIKELFNKTPIMNEEFYAARIAFTENDIVQDNSKRNEGYIIFSSALFGATLSILFILFFKPIRIKKNIKK